LTGDASAVLAEARAELLPDEWPHALVQVYLGELDPETLIDALEKDQGLPSARRRLAASHFYLGALARLGGREQRALSHLSDAVALSERRMPERVLAEQELAAGEGQRSARPISSASECRR
jgi:lipoprotein NlpI